MGHPVHHHCYQPHHNHLNLHHPHHHLINIFTTITRCSEDWFGLGWSEEKYNDFFSRGPLQLNMFKKSEETRKPGKQETTVNQVASKFEKMEVKNEAPKRRKVPKFPQGKTGSEISGLKTVTKYIGPVLIDCTLLW